MGFGQSMKNADEVCREDGNVVRWSIAVRKGGRQSHREEEGVGDTD